MAIIREFRLTLPVVRVEDGGGEEPAVAVGGVVHFDSGREVVHVIELALLLLLVVTHDVQIHHERGLKLQDQFDGGGKYIFLIACCTH